MYLKIQFLEGKARNLFFKKYPPKYIYVNISRLICAKMEFLKILMQSYLVLLGICGTKIFMVTQ